MSAYEIQWAMFGVWTFVNAGAVLDFRKKRKTELGAMFYRRNR